MSITAINEGKISDRHHSQKIAAIGMFIVIFAFILLSFLNSDTPIYVVVIAIILQALGMGLFSSPNMNAIMSTVTKDEVAYVSGAQLTMRSVGQKMSLNFLTFVFLWVMGNRVLSSEYT